MMYTITVIPSEIGRAIALYTTEPTDEQIVAFLKRLGFELARSTEGEKNYWLGEIRRGIRLEQQDV